MSDHGTDTASAFEALLEFLKTGRGFDFTGYKRASLERRVRRRMEQVGSSSFGDYLDYLEVHPDEYELLFNAILINVTEFFRDAPAWEYLQGTALPALLEAKPADEPIRVWSAGCATGQEAYALAMVLAELLDVEEYRERVKIYATDIDEDALAVARQGTYDARQMEGVSEPLRERYFQRQDQRFSFRKDLRRTVIFGRNNLVADAPISRLDLIVCRNTLMYLTADTQSRILHHFHFALRDGGLLMLGRSEMMTSHRELFAAWDLQKRIFRKLPHSANVGARVVEVVNHEADATALADERRARDAALDAGPHAQLLVSRDGVLMFANLMARGLFGLEEEAIGRSLRELEVGREPVDLQAPLESALRERRRVALGEAAFTPRDGQPRRLSVSIVPLVGAEGTPVGASISFEDVTRYTTMQEELDRNRRDLEAAYEELESTIDELETTNEELQSANEELQTTNEELQSTNEELETMNEELQSTNEELQAINDELRERTGELNQVNEFLEVILTSLGVGVVVIDRAGRVQVWNRGAEDLWGLRHAEAVDQHFLGLDIGLRPARLAQEVSAVLAEGQPNRRTLEAVNRRGRPISCIVSVLPLVSSGDGDGDGKVRGAIVLMEDGSAEGSEAIEMPSTDGR
jgi:two-component system, chemotaxis family, CheB/CheR fusion protein